MIQGIFLLGFTGFRVYCLPSWVNGMDRSCAWIDPDGTLVFSNRWLMFLAVIAITLVIMKVARVLWLYVGMILKVPNLCLYGMVHLIVVKIIEVMLVFAFTIMHTHECIRHAGKLAMKAMEVRHEGYQS
ncbi:hypothetical protein Tco_1073634 [Tanacetum coccineum]